MKRIRRDWRSPSTLHRVPRDARPFPRLYTHLLQQSRPRKVHEQVKRALNDSIIPKPRMRKPVPVVPARGDQRDAQGSDKTEGEDAYADEDVFVCRVADHGYRARRRRAGCGGRGGQRNKPLRWADMVRSLLSTSSRVSCKAEEISASAPALFKLRCPPTFLASHPCPSPRPRLFEHWLRTVRRMACISTSPNFDLLGN